MEKKNYRFFARSSIVLIFVLIFIVLFTAAFSFQTVKGQEVEATETPVAPQEEPAFEAYAIYTPTPLPDINTYDNAASFTFRDIGEASMTLRFPSIGEMFVAFPNQWEILYSQSVIDIHYDLFEENDWDHGRPLVEVYVGDYYAGAFAPVVGENQSVQIRMPSSLAAERVYNVNNSYSLEFVFIDGDDGDGDDTSYVDWCDYSGTLTIRDDSVIGLTFRPVGAAGIMSSM